MLEILRVHFEIRAFREDALRAVSQSVKHLNELIGRLEPAEQELKSRPCRRTSMRCQCRLGRP